MKLPWDSDIPPDFINEVGTKWWIDNDLTKYASEIDCTVWFIETVTGGHTRILVSRNDYSVLHDDTTLEGMCCHIDMLKIEKRFMA